MNSLTKGKIEIREVDSINEALRAVFIDDRFGYYAEIRPYEDFEQDIELGRNEWAEFDGYFKATDGHRYAQWWDYGADTMYIALIY